MQCVLIKQVKQVKSTNSTSTPAPNPLELSLSPHLDKYLASYIEFLIILKGQALFMISQLADFT